MRQSALNVAVVCAASGCRKWLHRREGWMNASVTVHRALWSLNTSHSAHEHNERVDLVWHVHPKHALCQVQYMMHLSVVSTNVNFDVLPYGVYLTDIRQRACPWQTRRVSVILADIETAETQHTPIVACRVFAKKKPWHTWLWRMGGVKGECCNMFHIRTLKEYWNCWKYTIKCTTVKYALSCIFNITNTYVQPDDGRNSERNM
jgi:hypothetical protein